MRGNAGITAGRRRVTGALLSAFALGVLALAGAAAMGAAEQQPPTVALPNPVAGIRQLPLLDPGGGPAAAVPILVYHEMNNGCAPTAPVCSGRDPETVSTRQFTDEISWLYRSGHHAITLTQYLTWLRHPTAALPARPILITFDNGIENLLRGAQPILYRYRFTATAMIVTGFADGASHHCLSRQLQPGCYTGNRGWDATWPQLYRLSPRVYSFALEAGQYGHFVPPRRGCTAFYPCHSPAMVQTEIVRGIREARSHLGRRFSAAAWTVPYSDLGYHRCAQSDCTPQNRNPWLVHYAARRFRAVFVEDASRNGIRHERFRMDINGRYTLSRFVTILNGFISQGVFNR